MSSKRLMRCISHTLIAMCAVLNLIFHMWNKIGEKIDSSTKIIRTLNHSSIEVF